MIQTETTEKNEDFLALFVFLPWRSLRLHFCFIAEWGHHLSEIPIILVRILLN